MQRTRQRLIVIVAAVAVIAMAGDLAALLNESRTTIGTSKVTPTHLADLAKLLDRQVIGSAGAKAAIRRAFESAARFPRPCNEPGSV